MRVLNPITASADCFFRLWLPVFCLLGFIAAISWTSMPDGLAIVQINISLGFFRGSFRIVILSYEFIVIKKTMF